MDRTLILSLLVCNDPSILVTKTFQTSFFFIVSRDLPFCCNSHVTFNCQSLASLGTPIHATTASQTSLPSPLLVHILQFILWTSESNNNPKFDVFTFSLEHFLLTCLNTALFPESTLTYLQTSWICFAFGSGTSSNIPYVFFHVYS